MTYEHPVYTLDSVAAREQLAGAARRAPHRLRGRLPRLGLPRGRRRQRLRGRRSHARGCRVSHALGALRRRARARALRPGAQRVPLPHLSAPARPRRARRARGRDPVPLGRPQKPRRAARCRPSRRSEALDPRQRALVARRARRRPCPTAASSCSRTRARSGTSSTRSRSTSCATPTSRSPRVVAEVHNTFGERWPYLLGAPGELDGDGRMRFSTDEALPRLAVHGRLGAPTASCSASRASA